MDRTFSRQRGWDVVPSFVGGQFLEPGLFERIQAHPLIAGDTSWGVRNLLQAIVLATRPQVALEFGAKIGAASVVIGSALRANRFGAAYHIERNPDFYAVLKQFVAEAELGDFSFPMQMDSSDPSLEAMFRDQADLIFLDGSHDYSKAFGDLVVCDRLLSPNGILVVDDAAKGHSDGHCEERRGGVRRAIADFVGSRPFGAIFLEPPLWLNPCGAAILSRLPVDVSMYPGSTA